jgi:ADP-ribosylglycohydrolase
VERAIGCLTGVAVGDAMGMPSELWSRRKVKERFGRITGFLPGPDDHFIVSGFKAGQFTDDTAQTLKICESIIANGGRVDPESVARAILEWAEQENAFETNALGPSSQKALLRIKEGVPVEEAGSTGDTNGAAMRIAPIGILRRPDDVKALVDDVERACLGTHNTNVAIAGASMLAAAISCAMETRDWDEILGIAFEAHDEGMERGNDTFGASSKERTRLAIELVGAKAGEEEAMDRLYDLIGAGVATTEAVPTAIALSFYAEGDPARACLLAANLGGDCDTVGAMTGALSGAYAGVDAFPTDWIRTVQEVNRVDLEDVAARLQFYRR